MCKRVTVGWASLCVVCGDPVPEGVQVCPICADAAEQAAFERVAFPPPEEEVER